MKLLVITQKVDMNDDILGFFHGWLLEFAKYYEKLTVICLSKGEFNLPANVKVLSLGKGKKGNRVKYLWRFYKYIFQRRNDYDKVFVHMNAEYAVLGGIVWRLLDKSVSLWYAHKAVGFMLRLAEKFVDNIFSPAPASFNLKSSKLKIVGHGIPVEFFRNLPIVDDKKNVKLKIISVGRITKIKNLDTLIVACGLLKKRNLNFEVSLLGPVSGEEDKKYFECLKALILKNGLNEEIKFLGSAPNNIINEHYRRHCLSVNLASTGGLDKAVLESMAAGLLTLASNRDFEEYFGEYKDVLMFEEKNARDLSDKIIGLVSRTDLGDIRNFLFSSVKEKADLTNLALKISNTLHGREN